MAPSFRFIPGGISESEKWDLHLSTWEFSHTAPILPYCLEEVRWFQEQHLGGSQGHQKRQDLSKRGLSKTVQNERAVSFPGQHNLKPVNAPLVPSTSALTLACHSFLLKCSSSRFQSCHLLLLLFPCCLIFSEASMSLWKVPWLGLVPPSLLYPHIYNCSCCAVSHSCGSDATVSERLMQTNQSETTTLMICLLML